MINETIPTECAIGALDLMQRPALRWPPDVSRVTGLAEPTLRKLRADGDHPRLYGIGRALFTTPADLREWILQHELSPGARMRAAGPGRPAKVRAGQTIEVAA